MERQIIIHIGLHKTGTTYLQQFFFKNLQDVEFMNYDFTFDLLAKSTESSVSKKFLLSNEGLSGMPWDLKQLQAKEFDFHWIDSFEASISRLKALFPDASILIFFRKHGNLLVSLYRQYIQEGGILKFNEFYSENGVITDRDLSFEKRILFLKSHFKDVHVLNYQEFKEKGDDYLISFFKTIDISYRPNGLVFKGGNKSVTGKKLTVLRLINKKYVFLPNIAKEMLHMLRISPRRILQEHLRKWTPDEKEYFIQVKGEINLKCKKDWDFVKKHMYNS